MGNYIDVLAKSLGYALARVAFHLSIFPENISFVCVFFHSSSNEMHFCDFMGIMAYNSSTQYTKYRRQ